MRLLRRQPESPRIEVFPLMDVVFLLLAFFIVSQLVTPETKTLPVELAVTQAGAAATDQLYAITVDESGALFFNQQPVSMQQLEPKLVELAQMDPVPTLFIAIEAESDGSVDRGVLSLQVIEACYKAGIRDLTFVGQAN